MSTNSEQIGSNPWPVRIVAFIIDIILVAIVAYIIQFIITIALVISFSSFGFYYSVLLVVTGVLSILYFVVFDTFRGGTIGKSILGLRVQMVNGGKVPFDKALIRNISKIFFVLIIIDWLIAVVTPGPDKRQKYTDRIAGTTVVQTKQALQPAAPSTPPPPPPPPP